MKPMKPKEVVNNDTGEKSWKTFCKDCQIDFETIAKIKYHRLKTHGKWKGTVTCELCQKQYGTMSNLRKHQRIHHKEATNDKNLSSIKCPDCPYTSHDMSNLRVHQRKHTGHRPFVCFLCNFGFYKNSDLTIHLNICKGVQFKCPKCDETFHFRSKLDHHMTWSYSCGTIPDTVGITPIRSQMICLNTEETSVIGINCEELVDENIFTKRKRNGKCGICSKCEVSVNCEKCSACESKPKKRCLQRRCVNLIPHYDVKPNQQEKANTIVKLITNEKDHESDLEVDL